MCVCVGGCFPHSLQLDVVTEGTSHEELLLVCEQLGGTHAWSWQQVCQVCFSHLVLLEHSSTGGSPCLEGDEWQLAVERQEDAGTEPVAISAQFSS